MAAVAGVSGSHEASPQVREIVNRGDPTSSTKVERSRAAMYKKGPASRSLEKIVYADGKLKWVETATYESGGKTAIIKRRVVCIWKNGKVLSGRLPEGVNPGKGMDA